MTEREIIKALIENAPNTYSGTDIELQQKKMFAFQNAVKEAQKYLEEPEEKLDCGRTVYYEKKKAVHYRPFRNVSELIDFCGTKQIYVFNECDNEFLITGYQYKAVWIVDQWYSMNELLEKFTFTNRKICGIADNSWNVEE